jgi:hypothetical protein
MARPSNTEASSRAPRQSIADYTPENTDLDQTELIKQYHQEFQAMLEQSQRRFLLRAMQAIEAKESLEDQLQDAEDQIHQLHENTTHQDVQITLLKELNLTNQANQQARESQENTLQPEGTRKERRERITKPESFTNAYDKELKAIKMPYKTWKQKVQKKLELDADLFTSELHKVEYVYDLISGLALSFVQNSYAKGEFTSVAKLLAHCDKMFIKRNAHLVAASKLENIYQGTRSFAWYFLEFSK